jgi:hypothetical protein
MFLMNLCFLKNPRFRLFRLNHLHLMYLMSPHFLKNLQNRSFHLNP